MGNYYWNCGSHQCGLYKFFLGGQNGGKGNLGRGLSGKYVNSGGLEPFFELSSRVDLAPLVVLGVNPSPHINHTGSHLCCGKVLVGNKSGPI